VKHRLSAAVTLLAVVAMLVYPTFAQTNALQQTTDLVCNGVYYNGQLHFSYRYPPKWYVLDESQRAAIVGRGHKARPEQGPGVEAEHEQSAKISRYLFEAARKPKVEPGVPSVSIGSVNVSSAVPPVTPRQFLIALDRESRRSYPWYRSLILRPVDIDGVQFMQQRSMAAPNPNNLLFKIYIDNYAVALDGHIVAFSFIASTEDEVNGYAASLRSFKTTDSAPGCGSVGEKSPYH